MHRSGTVEQHVRKHAIWLILPAYIACKPGQNRDWKLHHKICKYYNTFVVSERYQALTTHDKVDALLLSQLIAEPDVWRASPEPPSDAISTFLDLIKVTRPDGFVPPLCLSKGAQTTDTVTLAGDLYARFGSNNFVLHSHLNSYAHGVFPHASRYFNHSCVPNAACKYVITPSEPVRMEVVALRDINEGEEVSKDLAIAPSCPRAPDVHTSASGHHPVPRSRPSIPNPPGRTPGELRIRMRLQPVCLWASRRTGPEPARQRVGGTTSTGVCPPLFLPGGHQPGPGGAGPDGPRGVREASERTPLCSA